MIWNTYFYSIFLQPSMGQAYCKPFLDNQLQIDQGKFTTTAKNIKICSAGAAKPSLSHETSKVLFAVLYTIHFRFTIHNLKDSQLLSVWASRIFLKFATSLSCYWLQKDFFAVNIHVFFLRISQFGLKKNKNARLNTCIKCLFCWLRQAPLGRQQT